MNSGLTPGRFLLRCRIKKPSSFQDADKSVESLYFTSEDFFVGATLELNKHVFIVTEADEYVFEYMEQFEEREKVGSWDVNYGLYQILGELRHVK